MQGSASTTSRLAINGMGRIGRTLFRLLFEKGCIQDLVAVNDVMPKDNLIYLLKYDSVRGNFSGDLSSTPGGFAVDGHEIFYFQESEISRLPWQKFSIETVVEATGLFTHSATASAHLTNGAKQILLTTYGADIPTTVLKINSRDVNRSTKIISPGDCTINCVAPVIDIIHQNFGVNSVHINVIQGYTTRQELLDSPYKGFRRGRAAAHSIVPFEVNIKPVLESIFPTLKNKIESMSTRVPVSCGGLADITFFLQRTTDSASVASSIVKTSQEVLKNMVSITYDPIVSSDILGDPHSCTVDGSLIKVTNGNHLKLFCWFDNEWGYVNRLFDWLTIL